MPGTGGGGDSGGAPGSGGQAAGGGDSGTAGSALTGGSTVTGTGGESGARGGSGGGGGGGQTGGGGAAGRSGGGGGGGAAGAPAVGGAGGGGVTGGFVLTSPSLTQGGMFPAELTCAGANRSPELDWAGGPSAMSYALVLTDTANMLRHWAVWDIPATTHSLPAMLATTPTLTVPAGAHQASASGNGYTGPCPNGNTHTYLFELNAVDVATLPGLSATPTAAQAVTAIMMHSLGKASLSAQSNAQKP